MAKIKMDKIYSGHDELVHISSMGLFDPFATLCGDCDISDAHYEETEKKVQCDGCLHAYESLKDGMKI